MNCVDFTGWQDPWTQAADPWTSWNTSWQQQDGHGGWGHTAPLRTPPGVVPPAASEQWADRADAQDDWRLSEAIGDHGWKTQSQNWGWPTSSYSWKSSGPKYTLDRKDTEKPEKYGGDITKWVHWTGTFKRYLKLRCDPLWP